MRVIASSVLFGAGVVIGMTSFVFAVLWWKTADVARTLRFY